MSLKLYSSKKVSITKKPSKKLLLIQFNMKYVKD